MAAKSDRVKFTYYFEIAALRSACALFRLLGVDRASALSGFLWRHLAPFNARHRRADRHLRYAMPALSADERAAILGDMWENLGRTTAEALLIPMIVAQPWRFTLSERLVKAVEGCRGRGVLFCSLHQGNWELVAYGARLVGFPIAAVYKRLHNPLSEAYLRTLRAPLYDVGLMEAGGTSALRLRSLLRAGRAIAMLSDLPDRTGLRAPFFGHPANLSTFPVAMARRLALPLIAGRCLRVDGATFLIDGVRLDPPETDDVDADIAAGARRLHAEFEDWIRERPSQWMWATRKWGRDTPA